MSATVARRRRILFISEAVTLAHVARPAALFACVDPLRFEAFFACDPRSRHFLKISPEHFVPVHSIDGKLFADRLRRGAPVYGESTLREYVLADLALIERTKPDLIVGDFRLSLSVSARLARVPYACITNAYWSPHVRDRSLPLPVLPWTPYVPLALAQRVFDLVQALALARHCRPLNAVRVEYGLPAVRQDLRSIYTDADYALYADSPELFPVPDAPANHLHLGPVLWSPPVALPPWWDTLPDDRPLLYVTMGSSGSAKLLGVVIDSLAEMDAYVIASTAGAPSPQNRWQNVWLADYLPGEQAAARARLVVCNGGSPTSQQALAAGAPVIGVCGNMDQMLNMRGLVAAGAGIRLRADRLTPRRLVTAVESLLTAENAKDAVRTARHSEADFRTRFPRFLEQVVLGRAPGPTQP